MAIGYIPREKFDNDADFVAYVKDRIDDRQADADLRALTEETVSALRSVRILLAHFADTPMTRGAVEHAAALEEQWAQAWDRRHYPEDVG